MNLVYGQDEAVAAWVSTKAPHGGPFDKFVAVGVEEEGKLIAGWVYDRFYPKTSIHISLASTTPRWCSRRTLHVICAYPFLQLNVARMTAYTGKSMTSVRRFLERAGFAYEGTLRRGYSDDDQVVYGMLADECRWISLEARRAKRPEPACCA